MANFTLEANYRTDMTKGRAHSIRRKGWATGSVFGHNARAIPVEVDVRQLVEQVKSSPAGMKSLIELKVNNAPEPSDGTVIIKGVDKDPITRKTLDVQFQRVQMQEKVNVEVPVVLVGESPGAAKGGILEQPIDEIQISCIPDRIPPKIEVDISNLDVGRHISVSDIHVGEGIDIHSEPSGVVVACVAHRTPNHNQAD